MGIVMRTRLAVLVDGDNIGGAYAGRILDAAREQGSPDVVRVYANAQQSSAWHDAVGYRLIHAGVGKNASDLLLGIDAMELALTGGVEAFVIASSDGDFTHLVQRLREYGKSVTGLGEAKTPQSLRFACSSFAVLGDGSANAKSTKPDVSSLDNSIRKVIEAHSKNGEGMKISEFGQKMYKIRGSKVGSTPEKNWRQYLSARPTLYALDEPGVDARVRFKPAGFAAGE